MYEWQYNAESKFTIEEVKKAWKDRVNYINYESDKQTFESMKKSFDNNFLSIIKENPQITFKIFFPPYSILTFKTFEERELLEEILTFKAYIVNTLSLYKNIKIYDFQSESVITHNLSNYKDLSHYHQKINSWITEQIKEKNYLVTKENINEHLENLRKQIKEYDLSKLK